MGNEIGSFRDLDIWQKGIDLVDVYEETFNMIPTKSRVEELIEFSKRMNYRRLGMAFCGSLTYEASILSKILESHGFEVAAVTCKVGGPQRDPWGQK